jgi:cell division septation protein DedD
VKEELPLFMEKKPVVETPEEAFSPAPHPLPLKEESAGHFVFEAADREGETEERPAPAGTLFIHHRRNLNKKNMALVVALIFLGASASFGYFYFLAPKRAVLAEIVKVRDFFKTGPRAPETDKGRQDFTVKTPGLRDLPVVDKSVFSGLQNVEEANTKAGPVINSRKTAAPPRPQAMTTITKSLAPPGAETKSPEHFHSVQLGVFSAKANADKVLRSMKDKGYQAFITEAGGKKRLYRVLVGRFRTEREAGALLAKIKDRENFKFMPVLFYE